MRTETDLTPTQADALALARRSRYLSPSSGVGFSTVAALVRKGYLVWDRKPVVRESMAAAGWTGRVYRHVSWMAFPVEAS